ncbi:siroheme synthase CysG [Devosia sp. J2-20]|uniref:Uroporphyrinogen-III C-methyltransferase n=1 Tax=Devosia litorisediminis TaxID=2829817 RepID=A0A942EB72_9HYPH|nr:MULTISPECIES: siroheme synthase CysG [Devosia]MBS3849179.1 uroporphyrinogen-III C-methyltransferase [Devosia litorisediminis]WDQ97755.1 siroheme synthase CysG [Devosia sp. J2-20]
MRIVSQQPNRARIAPLAVLPVFFDLIDKRVIAIGGSEPASWKIELLAAAGAHVQVLAPVESWCDELVALAETSRTAGTISLVDCHWAPSDMSGAALAVADIEDDAEAAAFVEAAQRQGVPYNVIDRPAYCQFQFGSIVNRSPVVVGISTAGAAPILGQAVRRRIETLLPATLTDWAQLAQRVRGAVMARLEAGPKRRAFWERLAERAFGDTPPTAADGDIERNNANPIPGRVTLVGAGPGDADLLTIKAVRALQSADVILFDDLVSAEVLELARREAKRMLVGKRAARESCKQEDINAMMLGLAQQGMHVVRLKSGDPMIFGRAGEEIEMLERHGIAVSVVPGITAALALASRLGLSLTHRDHAQSVHFVTGHSRQGVLPDTLNWRALSDPATTSVYYMSRRTLPQIVAQLQAQGMSLSTPAIIAGNVGRADEQVWRGTIGEAIAAVTAFPLSAPTIFAVGNALQMRAVANPALAVSA